MINKEEYINFVTQVDRLIEKDTDELFYDLILPNSDGEFGIIFKSEIFNVVLVVNNQNHVNSILEHIRVLVTAYKKAKVIYQNATNKFQLEDFSPEQKLLFDLSCITELEIMKINFMKFLKKMENNVSQEAKSHILKY